MKIRTKAARGIEFGDVSNSAVRNILNEISKQVYGKITKQDMIDALDYFDWKCPYTGRDLRFDIEHNIDSYATDHIVPQNKEYCGLNVKGNLVVVDKLANSKKDKQSVEDFILHDNEVLKGVPESTRKERLEAIKSFQAKYGYDPEHIMKILKPYFEKEYKEIRLQQEQRVSVAMRLAGLKKLAPLKSISDKSNNTTVLSFAPADEKLFKERLIISKKAKITLKYASGRIDERIWNANNFDSSSNLRGNIQSTPFWRHKKADGLLSVLVEIID